MTFHAVARSPDDDLLFETVQYGPKFVFTALINRNHVLENLQTEIDHQGLCLGPRLSQENVHVMYIMFICLKKNMHIFRFLF